MKSLKGLSTLNPCFKAFIWRYETQALINKFNALKHKSRILYTLIGKHISTHLDDWLTVHRSITLFDPQLDAQNSYLFTYNTFIKILYMFRALPCSSSGGLRYNCIYAACGIITVCRWLSCAPVKKELNQCTGQSPAEIDDTRGCIYIYTITT